MLGDDDLLIILSPQAAVPFFHTVASLQLPEAHTNMIVSVCRPRHEGCTLRFSDSLVTIGGQLCANSVIPGLEAEGLDSRKHGAGRSCWS